MYVKEEKPELFFSALKSHPQDLLPIVYTPGVGEACKNWGKLESRPAGLTLTYRSDKGKLAEKLRSHASGQQVQVVVVTDGNRILGLGDLGANGMGISAGKAILYNVFGGLNPENVLPVVLDVGCGTAEFRASDRYVGVDMDRVTDQPFFEFVDEFHNACREVFGKAVLIHWEDFGNATAQRLLDMYRSQGPTINDDIQCTAVVTLAAILSACKRKEQLRFSDQKFVILGAGEAGLGIASLVVQALAAEGVEEAEARSRVWMLDSRGLLGEGRENMSKSKAEFAQPASALERAGLSGGAQLLDVVKAVQPTCLIGCAGKGGLFTKEVLVTLATEQPPACGENGGGEGSNGCEGTEGPWLGGGPRAVPIVLALSNPTDQSECTFQEAWDATGGHVVFASGSPFPPIDAGNGRKVFASQANNALVYPGLGTAAVLQAVTSVPDSFFLAAAHALADETKWEEQDEGQLLPPVSRIRDAALAVAARVCIQSSLEGVATQRGAVDAVYGAASGASSSEEAEERKERIQRLQHIIDEWRY